MASRRTGQSIDVASWLINSEWQQYNSALDNPPGRPAPVQAKKPQAQTKDYPAFFNTGFWNGDSKEPDPDSEPISFRDLRQFAEGHEITRVVIETCKDQLSKLRWQWRLKPNPKQSPREAADKSENDPRIKALNILWKKPDRQNPLPMWVRMMMEEVLVCGSVPIWKRQDLLDRPFGYYVMDTNTIRLLVDDIGMIPQSDAPEPFNIAYQQIIKGRIVEEFTQDELFYFIDNPRASKFYSLSRVEQIMKTLATGMQRAAFQLSHYTEGNIPAMFLRAPKEWTLEQINAFQIYWNDLLSGNIGELSKGWLIPGDVDPVFPQKEVLKDEFDEWIARVVCYAFSVSPNAFIKNLNRATSEQAREQADEEGLQNRISIVSLVMNELQESTTGYDDVEFHLIVDRPQDSLKQAEIDNIDIRNGAKSIDEVRRERGYGPIGAPNRVYTTNGYLPLTEGDKPQFDLFRQELKKDDSADSSAEGDKSKKDSTKDKKTA